MADNARWGYDATDAAAEEGSETAQGEVPPFHKLGTFTLIYESRDGKMCLFEDSDGHLLPCVPSASRESRWPNCGPRETPVEPWPATHERRWPNRGSQRMRGAGRTVARNARRDPRDVTRDA